MDVLIAALDHSCGVSCSSCVVSDTPTVGDMVKTGKAQLDILIVALDPSCGVSCSSCVVSDTSTGGDMVKTKFAYFS